MIALFTLREKCVIAKQR